MIGFPQRMVWVLLCVLMYAPLYAQETVSLDREFALSSANDAFVLWQNSDRFYSFGFGAHLRFKKERFLGLQDIFIKREDYFFELGVRLEGYTPTNKEVTQMDIQGNTVSFDRPFAGLLYGTLGATYAFERSFVRGKLLLGVLGPSSMADDFQGWFHRNITNDPVFDEWRFQVPDQGVLNTDITYGYDFMPYAKVLNIYGALNARLGNLYIDTSPTLGFRVGKFKKLSKSIAMGNNILSDSNETEFFLQTAIKGTITMFDATAQGNLFHRQFEHAIADLSNFHTTFSQSLYFSIRWFSMGVEHYFTFRKVVPKETHAFARILLKYRF
ncbi:MAG: lipid A-modifier LpxR family protein [Bacteroidota bacterium]